MITKFRKRSLTVFVGALLLLLLSACGGEAVNNIPTLGEVPELHGSPFADTALITQTSEYMKQLKSMHLKTRMQMDMKQGDARSDNQTTSVLFESEGDHQVTERMAQMSTTMSSNYRTISYTQINTGQQIYVKNDKDKWFSLDAQAAQKSSGTLGNSRGTDYDALMALVPKAQVISLGEETLNGVKVLHLALLLTKDGSSELLKASGQTMVQDTELNRPTVEMWIDPATHTLHRTQTRFQMTSSVSGRPTSTNFLSVVEYSKFDLPVSIVIPQGATVVSDVEKIFQ